jgi:hypothetical protein
VFRVFVFTICHKESLVLDLVLVEACLCFLVKKQLVCFFFFGVQFLMIWSMLLSRLLHKL